MFLQLSVFCVRVCVLELFTAHMQSQKLQLPLVVAHTVCVFRGRTMWARTLCVGWGRPKQSVAGRPRGSEMQRDKEEGDRGGQTFPLGSSDPRRKKESSLMWAYIILTPPPLQSVLSSEGAGVKTLLRWRTGMDGTNTKTESVNYINCRSGGEERRLGPGDANMFTMELCRWKAAATSALFEYYPKKTPGDTTLSQSLCTSCPRTSWWWRCPAWWRLPRSSVPPWTASLMSSCTWDTTGSFKLREKTYGIIESRCQAFLILLDLNIWYVMIVMNAMNIIVNILWFKLIF